MDLRVIETRVPHALFGDPECCGCLSGFGLYNNHGEIFCNECGKILAVVEKYALLETIERMEFGITSHNLVSKSEGM
jgi:Fe2+ or Zn2+ uptake regulation protein